MVNKPVLVAVHILEGLVHVYETFNLSSDAVNDHLIAKQSFPHILVNLGCALTKPIPFGSRRFSRQLRSVMGIHGQKGVTESCVAKGIAAKPLEKQEKVLGDHIWNLQDLSNVVHQVLSTQLVLCWRLH